MEFVQHRGDTVVNGVMLAKKGLWGKVESEIEGGALVLSGGFNPDTAVVQLNDTFNQSQTHAGAFDMGV